MCARILVADDEPSIVETLAELLSWDGHEVLTAANGVEALRILEATTPDLVLLDFMMPLKDGLQTLTEIRGSARLRAIPVIMMTAAPMGLPADRRLYDMLLVKPFTVPVLRAALAEILARAQGP